MGNVKKVADTILAQLGGKMFVVCTGSSKFVCGEDKNNNPYLRFNLCNLKDYLPNAEVRPTRCTITLNRAMDFYEVKFEYYRAPMTRFDKKTFEVKTYNEKCETTYENKEVYCDQLQEIFEEQTGLDLTFCRVRFG